MSFTYTNAMLIQPESPSSGASVVIDRNINNITLLMTPAGTLAALDLNFPDGPHTIQGQQLYVWSSHEITSLTFSGSTTVFGVTTPVMVYNFPNTILANGACMFINVSPNEWTCVSSTQ